MGTATSMIIGSRPGSEDPWAGNDATASGVSWAAVAGGAFVSAALSLILVSLGAGLGLSEVSPWAGIGATASTLGTAGILWLIGMQVASSAMGGYLAGRLRTKWTQTHDDEVYFRDTAHGLLVWSVGLVITASFLVSSAASMAGAAPSKATSSGMQAGILAGADPNAYFVDSLFRSDKQVTSNEPSRAEASRIFARALSMKEMTPLDRNYLAQMISGQAGITPVEAGQRVTNTLNDARQALDLARKTTAHALLWMFIALLAGAFCSSYAATIGGRQRDHIRTI